MIPSNLKSIIVSKEVALLDDLCVRERLLEITSNKAGLRAFAQEFYFIRYDFCKLNFIVGAKCPPHEKYWCGLTKNLLEELGGGRGATHNQLYRDFLWESCKKKEQELKPKKYAIDFSKKWEGYCREQHYSEGLLAIGMYEALDNPDYDLLYEVIKESGVSDKGLKFFLVHAKAEHYEMFEEMIDEIQMSESDAGRVERVADFVIDTQRFMWENLLNSLEINLTKVSTRQQQAQYQGTDELV